jgi:predicted transposase/invertase (TIGR01784 family)
MLKKVASVFVILFLCLVSSTENSYSMSSPFLEAFEFREPVREGLEEGVFSTVTGEDRIFPYALVADPSYDQTFKKIFSWDNTVLGLSGKDRIMSILNGIFYPDAGESDEKIRKVVALPNEHTKFDEKTPLGLLKFDVACRCSCWAEGQPHHVKIFDIEMQTGYEAGFAGRLFDYGGVLRSANDHNHVIILAFLNYKRIGQNDSWLGLFYRDEDGRPTVPVNEVIDTHCVDLVQKAEMLKNNHAIKIGGKELGNIGKEWLKLLSMRHWAARWATRTGDTVRYIVPKADTSDPAINSALAILEQVGEEDLREYMLQESAARAMLQGAKEDGILQEKFETARRMMAIGFNNDQITAIVGLSLSDLNELINSYTPATSF